MPVSASQKKGRKYINLVPTPDGFDNLFRIIKENIHNKAENTPKKTLGPFFTDKKAYDTAPAKGLRITLIGHSSLLIEIDGKRILTDPVWSQRVSFTQHMGPKRFFNAPLALPDLPQLDAVIISHDHYDHLDKATIQQLARERPQLPFYTSMGVGKYLEQFGVARNFITEMDWGDSAMIGGDIVVTATPSRHFSGRGLFNRNETLWSSFVIKGPVHNIFFGADSGYFSGFKDIGETFGPFDLTMLEIGAYGQYWADIHMGPDHASNAHLDLKGKVMMPIHWGTFNLAPHAWFEPIERLLKYAQQKNIALFVPAPGMPTDVQAGYNSNWWKPFLS